MLYDDGCMFRRLAPLAVALLAVPGLSAEDGMIPSWEVSDLAAEVEKNAQGVARILEQIRPKEWIQDGAPAAYVDQHETLGRDLENLALSAQNLGRNPEKLSAAIDTFLWLDRFNSMTQSMAAGVRKYQNAAVADLLESATSRGAGSVEQLKSYMRQLAVASEHRMETAHAEAQRCRVELMNRPPAR